MRRLVLLFVLAVASSASAAPGFGVMADVGVPDGATASLAVKPIRALTLHGGVGHNYVSRGLRAGVTLAPFRSIVRPTLSVDYGRYAEGDANPLVRMVSGDASYHSPTLERVGYSYANAHVGLELGHHFTFYLRAGASRIESSIHDLAADSESITFVQDPRATVWTVSARIGLAFYLQ
jgi:opacity protein-like surface antigen